MAVKVRISYGIRLYGKIDRCGASYIATQFFFFQFDSLPLIPLKTILVLDGDPERELRAIPIRMSLRSILAAYLRSWGLLIAAWALFVGGSALFGRTYEASHMPPQEVARALGSGFLLLLGAIFIGRLSRDESARRKIFSSFVGYPVDIVLLPETGQLRSSIVYKMKHWLRAHDLFDSRQPELKASEWVELALHPSVTDPKFLHAALSVAHLDWKASRGSERARLRAGKRALWSRIKTVSHS